MSLLNVPNFSPIGARIRVLLRILQSVRKEVKEDKNEEIKPKIFACSYLGNGWCDFLQIWNVDSPILLLLLLSTLPVRHWRVYTEGRACSRCLPIA